MFTRIALVVAALLATQAQASNLRTVPTRIILDVNTKTSSVTIHNEDSRKAVIQAEVARWTQTAADERYEPSRDVLFNPVIFEIPPGGQQVVRVALQVGEDSHERAYRLFFQEVPAKDAPRDTATALLRIGIPIFVPPMREEHVVKWVARAVAGKLRVTAINEGSIHSEITSLRVLDTAGREIGKEDILTYVLPGQERAWDIPVTTAVRPGEIIHLHAVTDFQELRADVEVAPPLAAK